MSDKKLTSAATKIQVQALQRWSFPQRVWNSGDRNRYWILIYLLYIKVKTKGIWHFWYDVFYFRLRATRLLTTQWETTSLGGSQKYSKSSEMFCQIHFWNISFELIHVIYCPTDTDRITPLHLKRKIRNKEL